MVLLLHDMGTMMSSSPATAVGQQQQAERPSLSSCGDS